MAGVALAEADIDAAHSAASLAKSVLRDWLLNRT